MYLFIYFYLLIYLLILVTTFIAFVKQIPLPRNVCIRLQQQSLFYTLLFHPKRNTGRGGQGKGICCEQELGATGKEITDFGIPSRNWKGGSWTYARRQKKSSSLKCGADCFSTFFPIKRIPAFKKQTYLISKTLPVFPLLPVGPSLISVATGDHEIVGPWSLAYGDK